jgi:hypothetical protein
MKFIHLRGEKIGDTQRRAFSAIFAIFCLGHPWIRFLASPDFDESTASPFTLKRYIECDSPLGLYLGQVASDILLMFFLSSAKLRLDLRASGLQFVKKKQKAWRIMAILFRHVCVWMTILSGT